MDKHFEHSRNLALALNEASTLIRDALPGARPEWVDDAELQQSLAAAAREAIPGLRLGALQDQHGARIVMPIVGTHWVCHRGVRSREQLAQTLLDEYPTRQFAFLDAPVALDRVQPQMVRIANEVMEGYDLDTSIGAKHTQRFG